MYIHHISEETELEFLRNHEEYKDGVVVSLAISPEELCFMFGDDPLMAITEGVIEQLRKRVTNVSGWGR